VQKHGIDIAVRGQLGPAVTADRDEGYPGTIRPDGLFE
jgi:hypothetical protein